MALSAVPGVPMFKALRACGQQAASFMPPNSLQTGGKEGWTADLARSTAKGAGGSSCTLFAPLTLPLALCMHIVQHPGHTPNPGTGGSCHELVHVVQSAATSTSPMIHHQSCSGVVPQVLLLTGAIKRQCSDFPDFGFFYFLYNLWISRWELGPGKE